MEIFGWKKFSGGIFERSIQSQNGFCLFVCGYVGVEILITRSKQTNKRCCVFPKKFLFQKKIKKGPYLSTINEPPHYSTSPSRPQKREDPHQGRPRFFGGVFGSTSWRFISGSTPTCRNFFESGANQTDKTNKNTNNNTNNNHNHAKNKEWLGREEKRRKGRERRSCLRC